MRRIFVVLALLAMVLSVSAEVLAQTSPSNPGSFFPMPGNRKIEGHLWITDGLYIGGTRTDQIMWFPAIHYCSGSDGTNLMIPTRVAQYDWALARTATGNETFNVMCNLPIPTKSSSGAGIRITGFALVQMNASRLTSNTWRGTRVITYASGVANYIASATDVSATLFSTPNMPTATQTVPTFSVGVIPATPPAYAIGAPQALVIEWTPVLWITSAYQVYGVAVTWTENW